MDPWIESQEWTDFRTTAVTVIREMLNPLVRPRYHVRVERRIYIENPPVECRVEMPVERRETNLVVREVSTDAVVAVVELLSPWNKRPGGEGRRQYLEKRLAVLCSQAHLVEIDLLRAGEPMPLVDRTPEGDYGVLVSRRERRPAVSFYAWGLRQPLPEIPVPLSGGDSDVKLELGRMFDTVYERAGYADSIDYDEPLSPPLDESERDWVQERLATWRNG